MEKSIAPSQSQKILIHDALDAKSKKDFAKAKALYESAIALGDQGYLAHAYYNKGVLHTELSEPQEALRCFQEAVSINPVYEKAWVNLGSVLLQFDRYREALYAFEKAESILPDQMITQFNKGFALNRLGRYKDALKALANLAHQCEKSKEVLDSFGPDGFRLYRETGLAYLQLGELKAASHYFRLAFNLNSGDFETSFNLGLICDQQKEYTESMLFYDVAIAIDRHHFKGYQGKACTLIHMKRYTEALDYIVRAIELAPDNFEPFYNLSCIYAGLGQRENLMNALRKTLKLAPAEIRLGTIIRNDPDFQSFKDDPEFKTITA
jgi:tetratricopeptide (TPR) repeat protein